MPVVLDASALVFALSSTSGSSVALRRRIAGDTCHAPHLIDAEVGSVLRRKVLRGELTAEQGAALLGAAGPLIDHRYEMGGSVAQAAWRLRRSMSFYDALYAVLASSLRIDLLTCDARLSRTAGLPCSLELIRPD